MLASTLILLLSSALLLNDLSLWHAKRRHASDALVNAGFVQFDRRGELPRTHKPGRRRAPRSEESEPQAVWWTGGASSSEWDVDTIERSLIRQGGWNGRGSDGRVRILFLVSYQDYLVSIRWRQQGALELSAWPAVRPRVTCMYVGLTLGC